MISMVLALATCVQRGFQSFVRSVLKVLAEPFYSKSHFMVSSTKYFIIFETFSDQNLKNYNGGKVVVMRSSQCTTTPSWSSSTRKPNPKIRSSRVRNPITSFQFFEIKNQETKSAKEKTAKINYYTKQQIGS